MKIGLKLPLSLTLSLSATATALSDQNVTLNDFVILCEIEDGCDTLDITFTVHSFRLLDNLKSIKMDNGPT